MPVHLASVGRELDGRHLLVYYQPSPDLDCWMDNHMLLLAYTLFFQPLLQVQTQEIPFRRRDWWDAESRFKTNDFSFFSVQGN